MLYTKKIMSNNNNVYGQVTASHDPLQFQYNMLYQLQPPKQEIIADLHKIVIKHLKYYKMKNGREPTRIIFYRDGVSEGQFMQVCTY